MPKIIRVFLVMVVSLLLTLTMGFKNGNVQDKAQLLDKATTKLVTAKNERYFQTKEQPCIVVRTVKRANKLTPAALAKSKKTVFIVVGVKKNKHNVQIYSTKDFHSAFSADIRGNIIRWQADRLRSTNKQTFNKGLRFVFRACATTIDQKYKYTLDQYDLTNKQQSEMSHPNRLALPIALVVVILIGGLVYFLKQFRVKDNN